MVGRRNNAIRAIRLIGTLVSAALLPACFGDSGDARQGTAGRDNPAAKTATNTDAFERQTGLALPAAAELVEYRSELGLDALHRAILTMPEADFYDWAGDFGLTEDRFTESKRYQLGPDAGQWQPRVQPKLPTAQARLENGMVLVLGVADAGQSKVKVYLVYHGT